MAIDGPRRVSPLPEVGTLGTGDPEAMPVGAGAAVVGTEDDDEEEDSSRGRAVQGGAFTLVGHFVVQLLRMGGQIVLTRLVPQEAFGLMAIVHTFRAAVDLFSDIGIGPSIIQNPRGDDPRFLDTAWTMGFGRGVALFLFATASALPMAHFYGHAELGMLIPAASVSAIIAGSRSSRAYTAERHLILGLPTLIEVLAQVAALGVMVAWALWSPTVWALVAGGLAGAIVDVSLGHVLLPGYNAKPGWEKAAVASLMHFGRWVFLSTVLTFAVNEADRLVFGKMVSLAELGVYNVALTIAAVPQAAMQSLASRVIFPLFSRVNQTGEDLAVIFNKARRLHLVLSGWALSGLIGGGPAAIGLVYDNRYAAGGWMLQILAVAAWFGTPEGTNTSANLACGQPRLVAAGNLAKLVGMVLLIPLGYHFWGFPGALLAYATSELFRYAASTWSVYRLGLRTLRQDAGFCVVVAVSSGASMFVMQALAAHGVPVILRALAVFLVATLIWSPWLWPYGMDMLRRLQARYGRARG
jgi:O-antigen/teichoic acid export membrane protein